MLVLICLSDTESIYLIALVLKQVASVYTCTGDCHRFFTPQHMLCSLLVLPSIKAPDVGKFHVHPKMVK